MPSGTATLNFGAITAPVCEASVAVTTQPRILTTSLIYVMLSMVATPEHTLDEIWSDPVELQVGNIQAATGFTIYSRSDLPRYGTYTVNWIYWE